ncbi:15990_t:CDS:2 [Acaulospora morrowiae]|uniref:15990_t:CDS:1 n=1 Tax=Acaulospora morrowiae TaxID=94023 RepID=A0A9N8VMZ4_9GLOM|nr:15990_t:CDS:2 [Acaulospora morrowiae]
MQKAEEKVRNRHSTKQQGITNKQVGIYRVTKSRKWILLLMEKQINKKQYRQQQKVEYKDACEDKIAIQTMRKFKFRIIDIIKGYSDITGFSRYRTRHGSVRIVKLDFSIKDRRMSSDLIKQKGSIGKILSCIDSSVVIDLFLFHTTIKALALCDNRFFYISQTLFVRYTLEALRLNYRNLDGSSTIESTCKTVYSSLLGQRSSSMDSLCDRDIFIIKFPETDIAINMHISLCHLLR